MVGAMQKVLIETLWNVKRYVIGENDHSLIVLIETLWNVKIEITDAETGEYLY